MSREREVGGVLFTAQPETPQTCCKLWILPACYKLSTSCSKSVKMLKQLASSLWIKSLDHQLAAFLLTTCSRLVIIKPEQAMRTHPDVGLMTAKTTNLQQTCCNLLCNCVSDHCNPLLTLTSSFSVAISSIYRACEIPCWGRGGGLCSSHYDRDVSSLVL